MIPSLASNVNPRLLIFLSLAPFVQAADPVGAGSKTARLTLYLSGVECPGCASSVNHAISQLKGVGEVVSGQWVDDFVNVTFDPGVVTVHQLAHAVSEAIPLHGVPYQAFLKLTLPDYAREGNDRKVDALLQGWSEWADIEVLDRGKGQFALKFKPLKPGVQAGPQGMALEKVIEDVTAPAPKGIGLRLEIAAAKEPM